MAKFWKSKTILAKIEATYGTDPVPTGATNAILAQDVTFTPQEAEVIQRNIERTTFGARPFVAQGFRSRISFSIDLVGSGTAGTAPKWSPLIRACAFAETVTPSTKVEYSPITDNAESVALYFDVDGIKHVMLGARGTARISLGVNGNPIINFTFTSLYTVPVDAVKPTADYTGWQAPVAASKANTPTFTVGGVAMIGRSYELDLAVQVEPRLLIGYEGIIITGRDERLTLTVEAVAATTYNPAAIAVAGTQQAVVVVHGLTAGKIVRIDAPYAQQLPLGQYQEQQGVAEWQLQFTPQPSAGNDQVKITLT